MQKIFIIRHETRKKDRSWKEDYKRLIDFLKSEIEEEGVEIYASLEDVAYTTASHLSAGLDCLRDKYIFFRDNQLQGVGPYGKSKIENLLPFPLFELSSQRIEKDWICKQAYSLFDPYESRLNHIEIDTGEMELKEALVHYAKKTDYKGLPEIIARTNNHALLVTHSSIVEYVQMAWGFEMRQEKEAPYLSGSVIIPEKGICREFGPVTRWEITNTVEK